MNALSSIKIIRLKRKGTMWTENQLATSLRFARNLIFHRWRKSQLTLERLEKEKIPKPVCTTAFKHFAIKRVTESPSIAALFHLIDNQIEGISRTIRVRSRTPKFGRCGSILISWGRVSNWGHYGHRRLKPFAFVRQPRMPCLSRWRCASGHRDQTT